MTSLFACAVSEVAVRLAWLVLAAAIVSAFTVQAWTVPLIVAAVSLALVALAVGVLGDRGSDDTHDVHRTAPDCNTSPTALSNTT